MTNFTKFLEKELELQEPNRKGGKGNVERRGETYE